MTRSWINIALALALFSSPVFGETQWNYSAGIIGDEGWGVLSPDYSACEIGASQSPINIDETTVNDLPALAFHYGVTDARMMATDHTLVITLNPQNMLTLDDKNYRLTQIRFHSPSEHQIKGRNFPLEIHLIHRDDKDGLLIVAVMARFGESNAPLAALADKVAHKEKELKMDVSALLPESLGYYAYDGSLTWPPCAQGVQWRVLKNPITLTPEQFHILNTLFERNARLLQPLNERVVRQSKD